MRWDVEVKRDVFEDVGAETIEISHGGTLVFRDEALRISVAYAAGQWLTVTPQEGES
jgi:hypothetical protein